MVEGGKQSIDEDHAFYVTELAPILPPTMLDFQIHTWDARDCDAVPLAARCFAQAENPQKDQPGVDN